MQAASLFAFGQARSVKTGIVCQVTNGGDHDGEPFNKGSRDQEYNLFQAICRAGLRYLETMS
jgi:hypothetical protein